MNAPELPILVAEDNEDEALLLERALQAIGVVNPLHIVPSGEQVIAYLDGERQDWPSAAPLPGVLITDLKMPRMNGFELLEWLRQSRYRTIPTFVFSNSSEPRDIQQAYALGANAYLVKPRTAERLEAMMRTMFEFLSCCATAPTQVERECDVPLCAAFAAG